MSQEPWWHAELAWSAEQRCPHAPQFRSSSSVSVQAPSHDVCPLRHALTQTPALQVWPLLHAFPQAPQFERSLSRRVQTSPQAV